jgi:8-oxo-dGTP pyrophosphatase MutT (NUDIX family)
VPSPEAASPLASSPASSFRRVAEHEVFRGKVFSVERVELVDPDGKPFERSIIRHPGAVHVVPVDEHRRVTLVRQYRTAADGLLLETPAGTCDVAGEEREATARRELAEEAGLSAARMEVLISTFNSPGISDQYTTIFLATGLSPRQSSPMGEEERFMTVETIALDDVDALIADGTLVDETTVLGLLLARARLDAGTGAGTATGAGAGANADPEAAGSTSSS